MIILKKNKNYILLTKEILEKISEIHHINKINHLLKYKTVGN